MISLNSFPEFTDTISKIWIAYKKEWGSVSSQVALLPPSDIACCIGRKNFYAKFVIWDGSYNLTVCLHLMEPIWWHLDSNPWPHVTLRPLAHLNQEHSFGQLFTVSQSILEDDLPAAVTPDDDVIKLPEVELEKFISNVRTLVGIFRLATCPVWCFVVTELYFIPTLTTYFRK